MKLIIACVLAVTLLGCEKNAPTVEGKDASVTNAAATVSSVKRDLDRILSVYESEHTGTPRPNLDCEALIRSLDQKSDQLACCRYFIDRIFALKLDGLSYQRQEWVISLVRHNFSRLASIAAGGDRKWIDSYDVTIKMYVWWKSQIMRIRPRHRRDKDEPRTFDLERDKELEAWRWIYYDGIQDFENMIGCEEYAFNRRKQMIPEDDWMEIKVMFEKALGRPLRSEERSRSDYRAKIWVDFPDVKFDKDALP